MKNEVFSFYIVGEHMGNQTINETGVPGGSPTSFGPVVRFKQKQQFELLLGTHRTVPGNMANRMIGMLQGFNMYTYIDEEMLKNISGCQYQKQGDFISWEMAEWDNTGNNDSLIVTKELEFKEI